MLCRSAGVTGEVTLAAFAAGALTRSLAHSHPFASDEARSPPTPSQKAYRASAVGAIGAAGSATRQNLRAGPQTRAVSRW